MQESVLFLSTIKSLEALSIGFSLKHAEPLLILICIECHNNNDNIFAIVSDLLKDSNLPGLE